MGNTYTAILKQEGDWWVGWIQEIPGVNRQERSYEELKQTLAITLREALELNRQDTGYSPDNNSFPSSQNQ